MLTHSRDFKIHKTQTKDKQVNIPGGGSGHGSPSLPKDTSGRVESRFFLNAAFGILFINNTVMDNITGRIITSIGLDGFRINK